MTSIHAPSTIQPTPFTDNGQPFITKNETTVLHRRMSLPDLEKLKEAWAQQGTTLPPGKLQIDLIDVRSDVDIHNPRMRIRMGSQQYYSSRSKSPNGNWNEGFLFTVSYHNQLFDTIELDLYDRRKGWRSKTKHIGKGKLKISKLKNRHDVHLTFLPMYEYHIRRYLPAHIPLPHNFLKSHMPHFPHVMPNRPNKTNRDSTLWEQDHYKQHPNHRKNSMTPFIGSIHIRIRYVFQHPPDMHDSSIPVYLPYNDSASLMSFRSAGGESWLCQDSQRSIRTTSIYSDNSSSLGSFDKTTCPDDDDNYHDAIEPDLVHVTSIHQVHQQAEQQHNVNTHNVQRSTTLPGDDDDSFGFSRCDVDGRNLLLARVTRRTHDSTLKMNDRDSAISDASSIKSRNFGDKNFAFRWINESFEEVALSHPSLDRMIGFVVSPQTRTLVRAVVKMMNAFGQGFKVTSMQLFSSLSLLQRFYTDIPRSPPAGKVTDLRFLDEAHYFLGHAIIAYGWRGLSYLGDYAKYLKDVMKTRSNKLAIFRFLKIPQEDLLGYEYGLRKGAVFQPSYFVSVDRGHEAVVLGIRGTWSLYDVITDLVCDYKPWKGGLVHSGILASAQWFFSRIIPQIFHYIHQQSIKQEAPFINSFIITGHSLGAGTAAVLTMMVADHLDELRQLSNNPHFKVHCYSYAPVATVSLDLSEQYKDYIDSFVCHDDVVARLSYGTASYTKELVMDAVIAADGLGGMNKVNTDEATRKAWMAIIKTRRDDIFSQMDDEPRYPYLYVPGKVFQFRRRQSGGDQDVFTLHQASALISEEMVISKTCLEDHMLVTYLKAFQQARQDCMRAMDKSATTPYPNIRVQDPDGKSSLV
ncbi:hypothetical protein BC941DRAFT_399093 [Chlamydoabsidia padenii]|nr:hypothetical protein BC941DRAFT_399093 [Chlamydoabsidia padenii]